MKSFFFNTIVNNKALFALLKPAQQVAGYIVEGYSN